MVTTGPFPRRLAQAYPDIALRHLQASRLLLPRNLYDISAFLCCHAFESIACAALALENQDPRQIRSNIAKIDAFRGYVGQIGAPLSRQADIFITQMQGLGSISLYPEGALLDPLAKFTQRQVAAILQRVEDFVRQLRAYLGV